MPVTDANITAIQAEGWAATYTAPPTFDPVGDPKYVVALRPGFNAAGAPITVTDNLLLMSRVRKPYPDQNDLTPNDVAMQDFVFAGDTIVGVTNNSTVAYHKPICMWLDQDLTVVTDQSYTAKLAIAHWAARSGRPVAAVKLTASDGVTTLSQTVSAMTKTDYAASGLSVPHFEATFDLSTLADDALITIDAVIYPWVGDAAFTASSDFAAYGSINFGAMKVYNNSTEPAYAYVDGVGAAPAVNANPVTAAASPYATVAAAAAAIKLFNNANYSRNNTTGGVIRLETGTHTHSSFSASNTGNGPLVVEAANAADKLTTIYQDAGGSTSNGLPDKTVFRDITLKRNASGSVIFLDNGAGTASTNMLAFNNCHFDFSGFGAVWGAWLYRVGRCWMIGCGGDGGGLVTVFSSANKTVNLIGCSGDYAGATAVYNAAGVYSPLINVGLSISGSREAVSGQFFGFSHLTTTSLSAAVLRFSEAIDAAGVAVVGLVIEKRFTGSANAFAISNDGITTPAANVVLQNNTVVGQRTNIGYNDAAPYTSKVIQSRFCVFDEINTKSDVFELDAAAVNNWPVIYKTGWHSNCYIRGSSGDEIYRPGSWMGEHASIGDVNGSDAVPFAVDWLNDQSADGAGAGGGDYRPGALSALPFIAAGLAPYPFDMNGTAIADNGTAYVGALQPQAAEVQFITGANFEDADQFGSGSVSTGPVTITGMSFGSLGGFGLGAIVQAGGLQLVTGSGFNDTDQLGTGTVSTGPVTIAGASFADSDDFGLGAVVQAGGIQLVTGSGFDDTDQLGTGTVSTGPVTITGASFSDNDGFGLGAVVQAGGLQLVTGSGFDDTNQLGTGTVWTGPVTIAGASFADSDDFGLGTVVQAGGVQLVTGSGFDDTDQLGTGTVWTGPVVISGAPLADLDSFGVGSIHIQGYSTRRIASPIESRNRGWLAPPTAAGGTSKLPQIFDIKSGDTSPSVKYILDLYDGQTLNGATARFVMGPRDGGLIIDRACVIDEAAPALIHHWIAGDTDAIGLFRSEFHLTYGDGSVETFPNAHKRYIYIRISGRVA